MRRGDRFDTLLAEYRSVRIGPLMLREVTDLVRAIVRSYDPVVYGHVWDWREGLDDLVQQFCTEVLIEQGQLDYAVLVAADYAHFRRLLARQLRHLLARRRTRTVIDNLLDRCKRIVASSPFRIVTQHSGWSYTLEKKRLQEGQLRASVLAEIAAGFATHPTARGGALQRASSVYTADALRFLLQALAEASSCAVSVDDVRRVLTRLLTCWLPGVLQQRQERPTERPACSLTAEELRIVAEVTESILESCSSVQREVLRMKLDGLSDGNVGARIGLSRPTIAKRKKEVLEVLQSALSDLTEPLREAVMAELGGRLLNGGGTHDG